MDTTGSAAAGLLVQYGDAVAGLVVGVAAQGVLPDVTTAEVQVEVGAGGPVVHGRSVGSLQSEREDSGGFDPHLTDHEVDGLSSHDHPPSN